MNMQNTKQDFSDEIRQLQERLKDAARYLNIANLRVRQKELEAESARPDLWIRAEQARTTTTELASVNEDLSLYDDLDADVSDVYVLNEIAVEETDLPTAREVEEAIAALCARFDTMELRALLPGDFDQRDAVCQIKSGEGGTDAQDWAEMLLRMYRKWAEKRGFQLEVIALSPGNEAGYSNVDFLIKGRYAYGWMRAEHGVHRLVRISPFNSEGKRQTSFTAVEVAPLFEETSDEVTVEDKDLRVDTYRSSGAGGQHVNVTDSAVRITHIPTGIVTSCQNERSQHQNKDRAMQMLKTKLADLERKKRDEAIANIKGEQVNVGFGSQIRSYVLHPYQMVKDLRTSHSTGSVDSVLAGDLDPFMVSWMQWHRT